MRSGSVRHRANNSISKVLYHEVGRYHIQGINIKVRKNAPIILYNRLGSCSARRRILTELYNFGRLSFTNLLRVISGSNNLSEKLRWLRKVGVIEKEAGRFGRYYLTQEGDTEAWEIIQQILREYSSVSLH